jgi:2-polyprenyl-6-methoxyphenol hydroxylase-like FAD-dependent oxidoreductase
MSIRLACVGAGPGGLFLGIIVKRLIPDAEVTLFERNRAEDAFGFGVVFSDQTLSRINAADSVLHDALAEHGVHWDPIEVRLKGEKLSFAGNGMAAINRRTLLNLLQNRATELGVDVKYSTVAPPVRQLATGYDLVVAADGANSTSREQFADALLPTVETATAKFIWFGTTYLFNGLTFVHRKNEHGNFAVHGYPISSTLSTFIVEADEATWRAAGLDKFDVNQPPGPSDLLSKSYLEQLFAPDIDGHPLVMNNSRWGNFRTRRTASWHADNIVWLGDAVHTAHFSVGSGTKMAMEDAVSLAGQLAAHPADLPAALAAYEAERQPDVAKIQNSARPSLSWWEHFGRYYDALEPWQFGFHFFSRSIPAAKIRRRDPDFVAAAEAGWRAQHGADPLTTPLAVDGVVLSGRTGFFAADESCYTAADGTVMTLGNGQSGRGANQGLVVTAPKADTEVDAAFSAVASAAAEAPLVVVAGGSKLTRSLLSERIRFQGLAPTVVAIDAADDDEALTLVLSGRADAVAYPSLDVR